MTSSTSSTNQVLENHAGLGWNIVIAVPLWPCGEKWKLNILVDHRPVHWHRRLHSRSVMDFYTIYILTHLPIERMQTHLYQWLKANCLRTKLSNALTLCMYFTDGPPCRFDTHQPGMEWGCALEKIWQMQSLPPHWLNGDVCVCIKIPVPFYPSIQCIFVLI